MKKFIIGLLLFVSTLGVYAQTSQDLKSVYSLTRDTVTNTATITLTSTRVPSSAGGSTLVWVAVTKISGTVGGTITLQGSIDGTNWKAANTADTQTALATVTATDASNTYHWRLTGNPYPYYRVSWTGTGTMSASFTSKLQVR